MRKIIRRYRLQRCLKNQRSQRSLNGWKAQSWRSKRRVIAWRRERVQNKGSLYKVILRKPMRSLKQLLQMNPLLRLKNQYLFRLHRKLNKQQTKGNKLTCKLKQQRLISRVLRVGKRRIKTMEAVATPLRRKPEKLRTPQGMIVLIMSSRSLAKIIPLKAVERESRLSSKTKN